MAPSEELKKIKSSEIRIKVVRHNLIKDISKSYAKVINNEGMLFAPPED